MTAKQSLKCLVVAVVIAMALVCIFLINAGKRNPNLTSEPESVSPTNKTVVNAAPQAQIQSAVANALKTVTSKDKAEQMREGLQDLNHVPIEFYGKLEDQYGQALGNQKIDYTVSYNSGFAAGRKAGQTVSDSEGFFRVSGERGKSLGINPKIPGYALIPTNAGAIYSALWPKSERHFPDPKRPVVIKMWRLKGAEELIEIAQERRVRLTGAAIFFDLVDGKIVEKGGDVAIFVDRPRGEVTQGHPQDWSVTITPVDGGIIRAPDGSFSTTFEAPDSGYEEAITLKMNASENAWFENIRGAFFIRSRNGQVYSKLSVAVFLNQPDDSTAVHLHGFANANGSRNWEEDPAKIKRIPAR